MNGKYWDKAWSLVDGCTKVSPGCDHCWLKDMDKRFHPENLEGVKPRWDRIENPMSARKPAIWSVWSDLFHEAVPYNFIRQAFAVMGHTPEHTYLVLTKRPERALELFPLILDYIEDLRIDNVYLGVTAENQEQADKRIPILLHIPAAHRFVSIEPMLGPVDLDRIHTSGETFGGAYWDSWESCINGKRFDEWADRETDGWPKLDWVILGGETGHGARPMHPDWVRSVRDQCQAAGVPFWFKGWGEWVPCGMVRDETKYKNQIINDTIMCRVGAKQAGRLLDGREWSEVPW